MRSSLDHLLYRLPQYSPPGTVLVTGANVGDPSQCVDGEPPAVDCQGDISDGTLWVVG